jgi:hypothetical protein
MLVPDNALITSGKSGIRIQPEVLDRNIRNTRLIMDEYRIVETDRYSTFTKASLNGMPIIYNHSVIGKYNFYKGGTSIYRFEIVTDTLAGSEINGISLEIRKNLIRIMNNENKVQTEIEANAPNVDTYFSLFDKDIGNLTIKQYRSRSANQPPNSRWQYQTGFVIEIDGEEYGILAFYPSPKLYKNNGFKKISDENIEDKIILYIFMTYERFNRDREDNS